VSRRAAADVVARPLSTFRHWTPTPAAVASLADELANRIPQPVDELEVAAVIESTGVTDEVAREDFSADDVFALARQSLPAVKTIARRNDCSGDDARDDDPRSPGLRAERAAILRATTTSFLLLAPLALVPLIVRIVSNAGWSSGATTALMFGMSAAMLLLSGPTVAIGRRSAILFGFGYEEAGRRYLGRRALLTTALIMVAAAAGGATAVRAGVSPFTAAACVTGAAVLGLIWALVNILLYAGQLAAVIARLVLAALTGAVVAVASAPVTGLYVASISAVGLLAAPAFLLARRGRGGAVVAPRLLLTLDSLPYVLYVFTAVAFLLEPYTFAWLVGGGEGTRVDAVARIGTSLTAAVLPLAFSLVFVDRAMRRFWKFMRSSGEGHTVSTFHGAVKAFHTKQLRSYACWHALLSCACLTLFVTLAALTNVEQKIDSQIFIIALGLYWLFGCTQFTALLLLNLSQPLRACAPFAVAVVITAAAGALTAEFSSGSLILIEAAAASVVAWRLSLRGWRTVVGKAGHVYSSAF
jgi:hypothetical protein